VTNHFVAVCGYETDANGKIVGFYAKDNAVGGTADIHFVLGADGSITKPADPSRNDYTKYEYQLSEVKFHQGFDYKGKLQPTNDGRNKRSRSLPPAGGDRRAREIDVGSINGRLAIDPRSNAWHQTDGGRASRSDRIFLDAECGVVGGGLNRLDAVSVLDADHQDVSNLEGVIPAPSRAELVAAHEGDVHHRACGWVLLLGIDKTDRCLGVAGEQGDEAFNLLLGVADEARGDFIICGL
jgi:hypothetical protein